jgi:hypothetical protein
MRGHAISRRALLGALPAAMVAAAGSEAGASIQPIGGADAAQFQDVSPTLMRAICAHCVAYADLRQIARETDVVFLGADGMVTDCDRLDAASELEERLLLALCEYPAANDAERHDKATYLLGIFEGNEPEPELMTAILSSMTRKASQPSINAFVRSA